MSLSYTLSEIKNLLSDVLENQNMDAAAVASISKAVYLIDNFEKEEAAYEAQLLAELCAPTNYDIENMEKSSYDNIVKGFGFDPK